MATLVANKLSFPSIKKAYLALKFASSLLKYLESNKSVDPKKVIVKNSIGKMNFFLSVHFETV